jgi:hypothetical protein
MDARVSRTTRHHHILILFATGLILCACLTAEQVGPRGPTGSGVDDAAHDAPADATPCEGDSCLDVAVRDAGAADTGAPPDLQAEALEDAPPQDGVDDLLPELPDPEAVDPETLEPDVPSPDDAIDDLPPGDAPPGDIETEEDAPAPKAYGEICAAAAECESGLCANNVITGQATCTQACEALGANEDCPGLDLCAGPVVTAAGEEIYVCSTNDSGLAVCDTGCLQIKLSNAQGDCVCAAYCEDVSKCPPDFSCTTYAVEGGTTKACTPIGAPCTLPDVFNDCFGHCFALSSLEGVCTAGCGAQADCPEGWACREEPDIFSGVESSCQPL